MLTVVGPLAIAGLAFAGGYAWRGARGADAGKPAERRVLYYVDPMHPAYKSDKPGVAPDCGMELEPVYADGGGPGDGSGRGAVPDTLPAGTFRIAPERQQLIGVKFATVEQGGARKAVRTVGKIAFDETRIAHVHTRFEGWIEDVFVNFTGDFVRQGQPMVTVYSPEMLASQQELLLAAKARASMADNPLPSARQYSSSLFEAAKRRLQLWHLADDQIARVLETGEPIRSITVHAPATGYVTERNAFPGLKVTAESDLYTVVDLSRVWVVADVFETDIPAVRIGDRARVTLSYAAGEPLTARVAYVQPQVDPATRTLKVRLEAANPGTRLKPDMFVNVDF
jgi:multidrug efflux pump subunit AcrA (membrane-fusion protein)